MSDEHSRRINVKYDVCNPRSTRSTPLRREKDFILSVISMQCCAVSFTGGVPSQGDPMRILVIEDNPKILMALQKGLREHGFAADGSSSGIDGEEMAAAGVYDLITLDLMLPDRDGVEVCRNLRRRGVKSKILMLTALDATQDKIHGLDAGADDYLVKPFEFEELLARARALMRRGEASESRHLKLDDLELDLYTRVVTRAGKTFELSNKEFALLEYLMRNPNRVLSRTQIGEKVWDMSFSPTSNVVDVYISALRRKIAVESKRELIHTIKGVGYRMGVMDHV
jgi:DNA-binding response OmpR family regulator